MRKWQLIFTLLSFFFPTLTVAQHFTQQISFKQLSNKEIKNETVNVFFQDNRGFMWFGTEGGGLFRYDGYELLAYQHNVLDTTSIGSNEIRDILEDPEGNLWIATSKYINKYDPNTKLFTYYPVYNQDGSIAKVQTVHRLSVDRDGKLWFAANSGEGGVGYFNEQTQQFIFYYQESMGNLESNYARVLLTDNKNNIWVGGRYGLQKLDRETKRFSWVHQVQTLTELMKDRQGNIWYGSEGEGLFRLDAHGKITSFKKDESNPNAISSDRIFSVMQDREGNLWVSTEENLNILEDVMTEKPVFHKFEASAQEGSLSYHSLRDIYQDRRGGIWIGSYQHGINRYDNQNAGFEHYLHNPDDPTSLGSNSILTFLEDTNES